MEIGWFYLNGKFSLLSKNKVMEWKTNEFLPNCWNIRFIQNVYKQDFTPLHFYDRSHQTRVGDRLSSVTSLVSGVIKGSGARPVAFLVDDLAKLLESYGIIVKLFADDVKVYLQTAGAYDVAKLWYSLDLFTQWADEWQLSISIAKMQYIIRLAKR